MLKSIFLALTLAAFAASPALAQFAGSNNGESSGNFTYKSKLNYVPVAPSAETRNDLSGEQGSGWGDSGESRTTKQQGFKDGNNEGYGPDMRPGGIGSYGARSTDFSPMARGGSGASTGAPFVMFGQNTYLAPANLALRTQYGSRFGGFRLPDTNLDSFVHKSGYNEHIYGDEGVYGPPPFENFEYINDGIQSSGLTTGHPSDAPSAWGTPMKYNSMFGVIQGQ